MLLNLTAEVMLLVEDFFSSGMSFWFLFVFSILIMRLLS